MGMSRNMTKSQEMMSRFFRPKLKTTTPDPDLEPDSASSVDHNSSIVIDLSSDLEASDNEVIEEKDVSHNILDIKPKVEEETKEKETLKDIKPSKVQTLAKFRHSKDSNIKEEYTPTQEVKLRHLEFVRRLNGVKSFDREIGDASMNDEDDQELDQDQDPEDDEPPKKKSKSSTKKSTTIKLTPLEQQFVNLKSQNLDKVLAIQVGYKYKFFGADAPVVSKLLNIMCIPGKVSLNYESPDSPDEKSYERYAYCSIPDFRLHIHLKRLLINGLKVGVVDQTETIAIKNNSARKSKLFTREISKVYTMATYIENDDINNASASTAVRGSYIFAIAESKDSEQENISMVAVNLFSAEIVYEEFQDDYTRCELDTRLAHFEPIEFILLGDISKKTIKSINNFMKTTAKGDYQKIRLSQIPLRGSLNDYLQLLTEMTSSEIFSFLSNTFGTHSNLLFLCTELMMYLKDFELSNVFELTDNYQDFKDEKNNKRSMILTSNTLHNLEIFYNSTDLSEHNSLFWLINHTSTKFGARLLRKWLSKPLITREDILHRHESIEYIISNAGHDLRVDSLAKFLKGCPDLESDIAKLHYGRLKRKQIYIVMRKMDDLFNSIEKFQLNKSTESKELPTLLNDIFSNFQDIADSDLVEFRKMMDMINSAAAMDERSSNNKDPLLQGSDYHITDYFTTRFYGYSKIQECKNKIESIESQLQDQLRSIRPIIQRPQASYITSNREPYLIEVKNSLVPRLPPDWIKINGTKSVSRMRPPAVVRLYSELQYHRDLLVVEANSAFSDFTKTLDQKFQRHFHKLVLNLAHLDSLFSLAAISSISSQYARPDVVDEPQIALKDSSHPLILHKGTNTGASKSPQVYIPNDISMSTSSNRVSIITGPNMGGKSSLIRQIAISVILNQIGCYVPASSAKLGIFDAVHTRMGSRDDIVRGESTFQIEMNECCSIIKSCTSKSLVLLDEVGRGTSTSDGFALAYAILKYLITSGEGDAEETDKEIIKKAPFVLFITHFPELGKLETDYPELVHNYHMGYISSTSTSNTDSGSNSPIGSDDFLPDLTFLYTLQRGLCSNSYGLHAAKLAGIPIDIIRDAYVKSTEIERTSILRRSSVIGKMIKRLSNGVFNDEAIDRLMSMS